uniref:WGR domain-containing protein n=1 Tax=Enterococcus faecium TaxID=1352 RepID=UPI0034E95A00
MSQTIVKSTALFFKDGTSDKEYNAMIEEVAGGYLVNFAYGRRGNATSTGTKTTSPVTLDAAEKIYAKLVQEKTSKGYVPDGAGT